MRNFRDEIDSLSVGEKLELLDFLWEGVEGDRPALTAEQSAELDYRVANYAERFVV